jgi:hypothetical protein
MATFTGGTNLYVTDYNDKTFTICCMGVIARADISIGDFTIIGGDFITPNLKRLPVESLPYNVYAAVHTPSALRDLFVEFLDQEIASVKLAAADNESAFQLEQNRWQSIRQQTEAELQSLTALKKRVQ